MYLGDLYLKSGQNKFYKMNCCRLQMQRRKESSRDRNFHIVPLVTRWSQQTVLNDSGERAYLGWLANPRRFAKVALLPMLLRPLVQPFTNLKSATVVSISLNCIFKNAGSLLIAPEHFENAAFLPSGSEHFLRGASLYSRATRDLSAEDGE